MGIAIGSVPFRKIFLQIKRGGTPPHFCGLVFLLLNCTIDKANPRRRLVFLHSRFFFFGRRPNLFEKIHMKRPKLSKIALCLPQGHSAVLVAGFVIAMDENIIFP